MDKADLETVLNGANPLQRVVAVEPDLDESTVRVFIRSEGGERTDVRTLPFVPWLLALEERRFDGATTTRLSGEGYCWRIDFDSSGWQGYQRARWSLGVEHIGVAHYGNAVKQFLIASGITLFKGMGFGDLRRVQLDIETTSLSPQDPNARIFLASLANSSGDAIIIDCPDEALLLEQLTRKLLEWDPDVIEGHNLFGFDLPYIESRFKAHGMVCAFGRASDKPMERGRERNCAIGTNSRPFTPYYIHGRHILDTLLQVQRFDWSRGQISSYGLKECAQVYKIASPNRVYLDRSAIVDLHSQDPANVTAYARQDVEEVRSLAALIAPTEFYQTQFVPDSYQSVAVCGTGEKLNSLLVREYLRQGEAIPLQLPPREYPGGYTEVRRTGVIKPVVKADVESLYPSIMLTRGIKPQSDRLDIFLPLLEDLTRRRLEAKNTARRFERDSREHDYWDGLQNSYKTLINSFYGYIGGPFYFNDFDAARAVTEAGREIVVSIASRLEETGSQVVEIDTDGVYFRPPDRVHSVEEQIGYIDEIGATLPPGIRLAHDGSYAAMLSLKIKNYVLVEPGGRTIFKGSSLRSRADEAFGRAFLAQAVELLIAERRGELADLYNRTLARIETGDIPIEELAKRERVTSKMLAGAQKKRADALKAAKVKVGEIVQLYQRSDNTMAPREEYAGDEDRGYYSEKLYKFAGRLRDAFDADEFARIFPKPVSSARRLALKSQATLDF
jgi:DNA polymerase, archaea type